MLRAKRSNPDKIVLPLVFFLRKPGCSHLDCVCELSDLLKASS